MGDVTFTAHACKARGHITWRTLKVLHRGALLAIGVFILGGGGYGYTMLGMCC